MSDTPPKSAVELAMEKLARQDAEAGSETRALSDAQKEAIAEARRNYDAGAAECRILHDSKLAAVTEPDARADLQARLRRDLSQLESDRDRKIEKILKGD